MLYDPKWKVEPNLLSLDSLISWLETQLAERAYSYSDSRNCLVAEYLKAMGQEKFDYPDLRQLSCDFAHIALDGPETYGAALHRARVMRSLSRRN